MRTGALTLPDADKGLQRALLASLRPADNAGGATSSAHVVAARWQPVGMRNVANVCYANALLQAFVSVAPLRDMVLRVTDDELDALERARSAVPRADSFEELVSATSLRASRAAQRANVSGRRPAQRFLADSLRRAAGAVYARVARRVSRPDGALPRHAGRPQRREHAGAGRRVVGLCV